MSVITLGKVGSRTTHYAPTRLDPAQGRTLCGVSCRGMRPVASLFEAPSCRRCVLAREAELDERAPTAPRTAEQEKTDAYIRHLVEAAPPLTQDQRDKLWILLRPWRAKVEGG